MKYKFQNYNEDGDYTDYIYTNDQDCDAPDWVEVELKNPLPMKLAYSIIEGNPDFRSITLSNGDIFDIEVSPEWGNWSLVRLELYQHGGAYINFNAKHSSQEVEVNVTNMVLAFLKGEKYEPQL